MPPLRLVQAKLAVTIKANITAFSGDCMEKAFKDTPKSDLAVNLLE